MTEAELNALLGQRSAVANFHRTMKNIDPVLKFLPIITRTGIFTGW
jgi:hypothetical protein